MTAPPPLDARRLLLASLGALGLAFVVLLVAVLPAEHGQDPTGLGRAMGFSRLYDGGSVPEATIEDPGPSPTLYALDAHWELAKVPIATQSGHLRVTQGEERVTLPLAVPNLTTVTARLEWNDTDTLEGARTLPDLFELSIRAPDGRRSQLASGRNAPDGAGNLTVSLAWRSVPYPQQANGTLTLQTEEDTSAVGEWTFVVRLYSAGGLPDRTDVEDPGNNWTLTVTAEAYALSVETQAGHAGDRVRLTLPPGRGIEYKFLMTPGQTLRYQWTSTAPLEWNFHGEKDGQDFEDSTSHAKGASTGESGSLAAPFAGRHGWYWENRGADPVTITLQTSGEYVILGVPG